MITGSVLNRRVFIELSVVSSDGRIVEVEFVLDTGFTGVITLAPAACVALGLLFLRLQPAGLADGSPLLLKVYLATLFWDGEERNVEVLALEGAPLIGMTLLENSEVRFQGSEGGLVSIETL
jgi:clan AA aspartic protease